MSAAALIDPAELAARSRELEGAAPADILRFALAAWPRDEIAISTAFGVEGCALIDLAVRIDPAVQVFTVDTGYLFAETLELRARLEARYGIKVTTFTPAETVAEHEHKRGKLYTVDTDACCAIRKVEPTERAVRGLSAWIAGLRRDQSSTRAGIQILDVLKHADGSPLVKVSPLANWTRKDTWKYVLEHEVPYSPLLDQGYTSIGCWPCTRAVQPGEDERAGRWNGAKAECGIHDVGKGPEQGKPT